MRPPHPGLRRRDADGERARRTDQVMRLVERFVYDLGLLMSGAAVDLDTYVSAEVTERLRNAVEPGVGSAISTRPDFGEYAQVRIEGDLLAGAAPVRTVVEFDDRSVRVDDQGRTVARMRRRVRLLLLFDPAITRVIDHRLEIA